MNIKPKKNGYKFLRVREETAKNFNLKAIKMNDMIKKMGRKKKVHQIDIIDMLSKRPIYLEDNELMMLSKRRMRRIWLRW